VQDDDAARPRLLARLQMSCGRGRPDATDHVWVCKLLTFPISGPVSGTRSVLQTVLDEAESKYYDETAIHHEMAELERQHRDGA
jgi:hypothetical protein